MVEIIKNETKLDRINDDKIKKTTHIEEVYTNQEFYDKYAGLKVVIEQMKGQKQQIESSLKAAEQKLPILEKQTKDMEKLAKDCEARL